MLDPDADLTFEQKNYLEMRNVKSRLVDSLINRQLWNIEKIFKKYGERDLSYEQHLGSIINKSNLEELSNYEELLNFVDKTLGGKKLSEIVILKKISDI